MSVYFHGDGFSIRTERGRVRARVISLKTIWTIRDTLRELELTDLLGLENLLIRDRVRGTIDRHKIMLQKLLREELEKRMR